MWKALISLRWIKSVISTCRHKPAPIATNCWTTTKGGTEVPPLVVTGLRWITAWFLDVGQAAGILAGGVLCLTHGLFEVRISGLILGVNGHIVVPYRAVDGGHGQGHEEGIAGYLKFDVGLGEASVVVP